MALVAARNSSVAEAAAMGAARQDAKKAQSAADRLAAELVKVRPQGFRSQG